MMTSLPRLLIILPRAALMAMAAFAPITIHAQESEEELRRTLSLDETQRLRAVLEAPPPGGPVSDAVVDAWLARARAAGQLGEPELQLAQLHQAIDAIGARNGTSYRLHLAMRAFYADRGNVLKAREATEAMLASAASPGQQLSALTGLATLHSVLYDREAARATLARAQQTLDQLRSRSPQWSRFGELWQAMNAWANGTVNRHAGLYESAEAGYRACDSVIRSFVSRQSQDTRGAFFLADCSSQLIAVLARQGKLQEAGALALDARQNAQRAADVQGRTLLVARTAPTVARVQIEQGRLDDAARLLRDASQQLRRDSLSDGSLQLGSIRLLLATIEMLRGNWAEADILHRERRDGLLSNADQSRRTGVLSIEWGYTLLQLDRPAQALDLLERVLRARGERFDERTTVLWEARAFHALALAANGRAEEALRALSAAVPRLIELGNGERNSADSGVLRQARLNWILDGYIDLLMRHAASGARIEGLDAATEAFRMADLARGSSVQRALAASAARLRVSDPAQAELMRREQDLQREISVLADALGDLLARGRIQEQDGIVARLRADLERHRAEHLRVRRDIERRFPQYAGLLEPKPASIAEIQRSLRQGEALISLYSTSRATHVWAVPPNGAPRHLTAALGRGEVARQIARLRQSLDPGDVPVMRMPEFDFALAHELYRQLLQPLETTWGGARELIAVPHAALGQIPLALLTTAPFTPTAGGPRWSGYRDAPWLARRVAVSQLPSVLALPALRSGGQGSRPARPFVGFGNPVFAASATREVAPTGTERRNLAVVPAQVGRIEHPEAAPVRIDLLQPLPDTEAEVKEIARSLRADEARDVYLERRASEHLVKQADLAAYRVVMFATHGLVPGELPGLYQPALALSNPALTGESEDGLLTMGEILSLKLNADWVVLSACNTASGAGDGQEAVSGLGRAFFYAGAKSLLVTHWPVETVSARLLTTDLFRREALGAKLSRARALQEATLDLMSRDNGAFSYAHPLFWAPFTLYGDGG